MMHFEDRRSDAAKQADERRRQKDVAMRKARAELLADIAKAAWPDAPWQPIENCPFETLADSYGIDGTVLVTDGHKRELVTVTKRFGRPMHVVSMKPVLTDNGMHMECESKEIDAPDWWFEWELQSATETESECGFVPTLWMPLPGVPEPSG